VPANYVAARPRGTEAPTFAIGSSGIRGSDGALARTFQLLGTSDTLGWHLPVVP